MNKPETLKTATKAKKPQPKPHCHIHDKVRDWEANDIRESVCVNDEEPKTHTDGRQYCLFHLPTKQKDIIKFEKNIRARLKTVEDEIAERV